MRQMQVLHKAERFRPSYNQMKQRHDDDIVMSNLIRDAKSTCTNRLDGHILRFKELRQKHPNFVPGWLKRYEDQKAMEVHETIIKKARKWIDDEPPQRALHYRSVLKKTAFTKGGFPRILLNTMPKPRRRRRKKQSTPLPPRRGPDDPGHTYMEGQMRQDYEQDEGYYDGADGLSSQGSARGCAQGNDLYDGAEGESMDQQEGLSQHSQHEGEGEGSMHSREGEARASDAGSTGGQERLNEKHDESDNTVLAVTRSADRDEEPQLLQEEGDEYEEDFDEENEEIEQFEPKSLSLGGLGSAL